MLLLLQTAYYCNVSGDSRLAPWGAFFPLHVQVPVGLSSRVIFANITGTIPGTEDNPQGNPPSGGQQQGSSPFAGMGFVHLYDHAD